MKNTFGNNVTITIFGESHGEGIGAILDGMAPGIPVDKDFLISQMDKRRAKGRISTQRHESDEVEILSGVFDGKTTGTPICFVIKNNNTQSNDYSDTRYLARPGHADYTAYQKYHGFEDYRGGGHFSGRITAGLVAAGAVAISALKQKGIHIGTHIKKCAGISDREFDDILNDINYLNTTDFAVLDNIASQKMNDAIERAANDGDSVGGILETAVTGLPAGVGEPWFDSVESMISHILFSVPAVKGVEFGSGFEMADMNGSAANDPFYTDGKTTSTLTNHNGGINGGITNGMPLVVRCAIKPTPSIYKQQNTINFETNQNAELVIKGRHDPCIIHRARVVADSAIAIALCDMLSTHFGTDWLKG